MSLCVCVCVKVAQSCLILCSPMDYTVHWILQSRILAWVAVPFSRGLPNPGHEPRCPTLQADSLPAELPGKPMEYYSASERSEIGWFVDTWMNLESVTQSEIRKRKTNIAYYCFYVGSKKWYRLTYFQGRNRDADIENRHLDMGRGWWGAGDWEELRD